MSIFTVNYGISKFIVLNDSNLLPDNKIWIIFLNNRINFLTGSELRKWPRKINSCTNKHFNFLGIPEIVGQVAVIVTWGFTVLYLFAYFFMIVMILSHATVLENMAKKSIHHFFERRNQNQAKFDSDLQSQVTYTSRLSGSVRHPQLPS